jgi:hypothetical protein
MGMDGPQVSWTVSDLSKVGGNKTFLVWHVMESGYSYLNPLGCAIGSVALAKTAKFSHLTTLQAAGTGGLMAGGAGMGLGLLAVYNISTMKNPKLPWNEDGIQMRVDGLSHNYRVRALDLGTWIGVAAGCGAVLASGGPTKLGLSAGALGSLQAIALGSAVGSVSAMGVISLTKAL